MILITGVEVLKNDLPGGDIVDFVIENDVKKFQVKLKTVGKKDSCDAIYIQRDMKSEYTMQESFESKIILFDDLDYLIKCIKNNNSDDFTDIFEDTSAKAEIITEEELGNISTEVEVEEEESINEIKEEPIKEEPIKEEPIKEEIIEKIPIAKVPTESENVQNEDDFVPPLKSVQCEPIGLDKMEPNIDVVTFDFETEDADVWVGTQNSIIPEMNIDEVDVIPLSFQIPNVSDDTDNLRERIKTQDRLISQKEAIIKEKSAELASIYDTFALQEKATKQMWESKLVEANAVITKLKERTKNVVLDDETKDFLKYTHFSKKPKGSVSTEFTDDEMLRLSKLDSKVSVLTCATGDSRYSMLKEVLNLLESSKGIVLVDFSNDSYMYGMCHAKGKTENSMNLLYDEINPYSLMTHVKKSDVFVSTSFNDIMFLSMNWCDLLEKLDAVSDGRPIVLLFGGLNNFNVRCAVSLLTSFASGYVFAKTSPVILSTVFSDLQFIPKDRLKVVILDYIDILENLVNEFKKVYKVEVFKEKVVWSKLGFS